MSCLNLRQGIQDGRMGLGENVEFTLGHGEFELLMELSGRNVQEVGVCGYRLVTSAEGIRPFFS